jgi:hypothetical protein
MVDKKYRIDGNIVLSAGTRLRRVWTSPLWLNKPKPWHGYGVEAHLQVLHNQANVPGKCLTVGLNRVLAHTNLSIRDDAAA